MLFVFALPYVQAHGWRLEWRAALEHLRRGLGVLVGFAGFARSSSSTGAWRGDRQHHPSFRFHPESVLFALFMVFVVSCRCTWPTCNALAGWCVPAVVAAGRGGAVPAPLVRAALTTRRTSGDTVCATSC